MSIARSVPALLALTLVAGACDTRESPERREARREARRDACIAEEMFAQSRARMESLDEVAAAGDPLTASLARASAAYSQAFHRHATARLGHFAHADSMLAAPSEGDAARHAAARDRHAEAPADSGTVEANVRAKYALDLAAARANRHHPCNAPEAQAGS
jgi:hypothetical protein